MFSFESGASLLARREIQEIDCNALYPIIRYFNSSLCHKQTILIDCRLMDHGLIIPRRISRESSKGEEGRGNRIHFTGHPRESGYRRNGQAITSAY